LLFLPIVSLASLATERKILSILSILSDLATRVSSYDLLAYFEAQQVPPRRQLARPADPQPAVREEP
jgi:hypothetical protein